jgi:CoA:oxalate CoA-transferase
MQRALGGIRVLDLGQFLSAPRCGRILAELGADVIKVEPAQGDTMRLLMMLAGADKVLSVVNAGKRGLKLNLKSAGGPELLRKLVAASDVLLENFVPGTMERLGLGWDDLSRINPRLIYASISGFGTTGPRGDRPAFDIIAQATSGIMDALEMPDRPPPVFFADLVSGAYAALGIMAALFARERSGHGQRIDVSMQDVMYAHHFRAHTLRALGDDLERSSRILGRSIDHLLTDADDPLPFWSSYLASDGFVAVVALTEGQWARLMRAVGREDLVKDPRLSSFVARVRNAALGVEVLSEWVGSRTADEVVEVLTAARVPCGKVCSTPAANEDPQLAERGMYHTVRHTRLGEIGVPGPALKMSRTPTTVESPHPDLGQHTEDVLRDLLEASDEDLAGWRKAGAI